MKLKYWLQLGRAQTYPADWLLVLVPMLYGDRATLLQALAMSVFMFFVHIISFGENSLLDYTQGWDKRDPSKAHHPLETGVISVPDAMNFIHWGKTVLMLLGCLMVFWWSPNPVMAMFSLFMWYAWGTAYNLGLSKVTVWGFLPISMAFTFMGAFGWYLTHEAMTPTGWWYLAYVFTVILFQISWSGHLKEMGQKERSNLLIRLGARLIDGFFEPSWSLLYGLSIKAVSILILSELLAPKPLEVIWFSIVLVSVGGLVGLLCMPRTYDRPAELKRMSAMEVVSIYGPIPLMLPWTWAIPLMAIGIIYFILVNKALWGVSYPKV